jgi:type II secretory pathway pseudopilin PulG
MTMVIRMRRNWIDPARSASAGFGLVEVLIAAVLFSTGALALMSVVGYSVQLDTVNHHTAIATEAARQRFEELRGTPLDLVFAAYNADPQDDPGGEGTAPGATFSETIGGLGTLSGVIEFPTGEGGELLENVDLPVLGMPRDLNGDGVVDTYNHRDDYLVLPVRVRVTWTGPTGEREFELAGVLTP